jgi:hypothetical protein
MVENLLGVCVFVVVENNLFLYLYLDFTLYEIPVHLYVITSAPVSQVALVNNLNNYFLLIA